jgi:hypothetical protein
MYGSIKNVQLIPFADGIANGCILVPALSFPQTLKPSKLPAIGLEPITLQEQILSLSCLPISPSEPVEGSIFSAILRR